ncbi:MAG: hypothetical protein IJX14_07255 [Clostridia bacterium]|nr:hypothetical protein [Clostridia bacterium]
MKKWIALSIAVCILIILSTGISAAIPETIIPLWDNISQIKNEISFDGTDALAKGTLYGKSGITSMSGVLTVYKQTDNGWEYVGSDTDTVESVLMTLKVDFTAESGGYYKSVFEVSVIRDGVSEPETKTIYRTCP